MMPLSPHLLSLSLACTLAHRDTHNVVHFDSGTATATERRMGWTKQQC